MCRMQWVSNPALEPAFMDSVLILPAKVLHTSDLSDIRMTSGNVLNHFVPGFPLYTVMNESINYIFVWNCHTHQIRVQEYNRTVSSTEVSKLFGEEKARQ